MRIATYARRRTARLSVMTITDWLAETMTARQGEPRRFELFVDQLAEMAGAWRLRRLFSEKMSTVPGFSAA